MSAQNELKVVKRGLGKGLSRGMRKDGMIPAMIYGKNFENKAVSIDARLVTKFSSRDYDGKIFTLSCDDDSAVNGKPVIFKAVQKHPATRKFQHVDFYAVDLTETLKVKMEMQFEGTAAGTKEGGVFQIMSREIEVEALPGNIPDSVSVDVSGLMVGQSLHVSDVKLPDGVTAVTVADQTLCTVTKESGKTETTEEVAAAGEPAADS